MGFALCSESVKVFLGFLYADCTAQNEIVHYENTISDTIQEQ